MRTRKLHTNEFGLFEGHIKRLSLEERHMRFDQAITDDQIAEYMRSIKPCDILIGLFSSKQLIGAAHLSIGKCEVDQYKVEVGLSIETEYQGLGLGTELMHAAITVAQHEGYKNMEVLCHTNNVPMIKIANKFGANVRQTHGHAYASIDLTRDEAPTINKHEQGLASMRTYIL